MSAAATLPQAFETALAGFTLYPHGHPRQERALEELFRIVVELSDGDKPVSVDLVGDTLLVNGSPLFEESARAIRFIDRLGERGVLSLRIDACVSREDLASFFVALCRPAEGDSPTAMHSRLVSMGVTAINVRDVPMKETFRAGGDGGGRLVSRISRKVRRSIESAVSNALQEVATGGGLETEDIEKATADLTQMVREGKQEMVSLTSHEYHDHFTYNHSVNACILVTALAETFIEETEDLRRIAQAALLHDIGKICVPEQILYKPDKLDEDEWEVIRFHPTRGAEILLNCTEVDPLSVLVADGHHRRCDGTGYPKNGSKASQSQHFIVAIVEAVDVYEAMTAQRPYKGPVSPDRAIASMLDGAGREFDPGALRVLLDVVGFYPPGSTLELASGERARVVEVTPGAPNAPRVAIYQDADGDAIRPPQVITLDVADCPPEYRIVRCTQTQPSAGE